MTGYYKKPAQEGKLYPCKQCQKTPTIGQERYYEQIDGPDGSKVWIGCVDLECFKKQGGSSEPAQAKKGGAFQSTKFKIESATSIKEMAWGMLNEFEKKFGETMPDGHKTLPLEDRAIFFESIFRTLSANFKP